MKKAYKIVLSFRVPANKTNKPIVYKHSNYKNGYFSSVARHNTEYSEPAPKIQSESAASHQRLAMGFGAGHATLLPNRIDRVGPRYQGAD